jgi:hypothetical protein
MVCQGTTEVFIVSTILTVSLIWIIAQKISNWLPALGRIKPMVFVVVDHFALQLLVSLALGTGKLALPGTVRRGTRWGNVSMPGR